MKFCYSPYLYSLLLANRVLILTSQSRNRFTYHGSTLSQNATIDDEINVRISQANATFSRLHANVWNRRGIGLQTKLVQIQDNSTPFAKLCL